MTKIYMDHAATTPPFPEVVEAMYGWMVNDVANPSSIHSAGEMMKKAIYEARCEVARLINAYPSEIIFTSGATESARIVNEIVKPEVLVCSKAEHKCITELSVPEIEYTDINMNGDYPNIKYLNINKKTLYCTTYVNNETGILYPYYKIVNWKDRNTYLLVDATQAIGHIDGIDVRNNYADFMIFSAHKFGGPHGVGILYIRAINQDMISGWDSTKQEFGVRPGTENVEGIIGTGVAAEIIHDILPQLLEKYLTLKKAFIDHLCRVVHRSVIINQNPDNPYSGANNIISVTIPGIESESLLLMLDSMGIYCSAGSACHAHSIYPSEGLRAIGISPDMAASTIRISFGHNTTEEEVHAVADAIGQAVFKIATLYR